MSKISQLPDLGPANGTERVVVVRDGQTGGSTLNELYRGPKGDPGGNILAVGSFAAMAAMGAIAGTDVIRTSHYGPVEGRGGALYRRWKAPMGALPAWGQGVWWQQAADGSRWLLSTDQEINSDMFGTTGDGAMAYLATVATGTDVSVNLNNMRRWGLSSWGKPYGVLSTGGHRVEDTVHLSLGESYSRAYTLWGDPRFAWGLWDMPSAKIVTSKNDRPIFAVSGARGGSLKYIAIYGPAAARIIQDNLGRVVAPLPVYDDRDQSAWLPGAGPHSNTRYGPGCAIAIDPYGGVRPASGAYPTVTYNTAAGESATQYGRLASSEFVVEGCYIGGFSVGIAVQPSDFDSNGDFMEFPNNEINYCLTAIAIGNSQSRGINTVNLKATMVHTVLDTVTFGKQRGSAGGHHANWTTGHILRMFALNLGFSANVTVDGLYCEGLYRLADVSGNGALRLRGMRLGYVTGAGAGALVSTIRGFPLNHVGLNAGSGAIQSSRITMSGDLSVAGLFVINSHNVDLDLDVQQLLHTIGTAQPAYIENMHNALCGGLGVMLPWSTNSWNIRVQASYRPMDVTAANLTQVSGTYLFDGIVAHRPTRKNPAPIWATRYRGTNFQNPIDLPVQGTVLGAGTTASLTGNFLKMTYAGYFAAGLHQTAAMLPGDIWRHNSGYFASVVSFDTATNEIILHIWNGYSVNGGAYTWHIGSEAAALAAMSAGSWTTAGGRRYGPDYALTGTFTLNSPNVTNIGRSNGASAATNLSANVGVGDLILCVPEEQGAFAHPRNVITARDDAAKTITGTAGWGAAYTTSRFLTFTTSAIPNFVP